MSRIRVEKNQKICPYCKEQVDPDKAHVVCRSCLTRHHRECWNEHGSCSVFGCSSDEGLHAAGAGSPPVPTRRPTTRPAPIEDGRQVLRRSTEQQTSGGRGILKVLLIAILVALGIGWYLFLTGKPKTWDGKKTLMCRKGDYFRIQNRVFTLGKRRIQTYANCRLELLNVTLTSENGLYFSGKSKVTIENSKIVAKNVAVHASGLATIVIKKSELYGHTGLTISSNARVSMVDGRVDGQNNSVSLSSKAILRVVGKTVFNGRISRSGDARIFGIPEEEQKFQESQKLKKYAAGACSGLLACHKKQRHFGRINLWVSATVESDGTVSGARYRGRGTAELEACVVQTMKKKRIANYDGKQRGSLECSLRGTYLESGVQMVTTTERFRRRR